MEPQLNHKEQFAERHCDQWRGCITCKESHHISAFCRCGRCFFQGKLRDGGELGYFVDCACGETDLWD